MAINQFPLPDLGEGLTEGEILKWLVAEGDVIELNQPIVEVETAKAAVEIPAKWAGKVVKIYVSEGTVVEVGSPIISIDTGGDSAPVADDMSQGAAAQAEKVAGEATGGLIGETTASGRTAVLVGYGPRVTAAKRRARKGEAEAPVAAPAPVAAAPAPVAAPAAPAKPAPAPAAPAPAGQNGHAVLAKPPVRMLARNLGVDLSTVAGTGPQGSITRDDVQSAVSAPAAAAPQAVLTPGQRETRIPIKGVRKLTAANMVASAFTAPHVTEFLTVDVTRSMKALDRLKADREWRDVRVSPLLLVAKAVLLAAKRHPMVNSSWDEAAQEIVVKDYVNLGIAAATERGLIVPNIADAGRLSLRELADAMTDLVQTAKSGKTPPSAMSGGTFTITNVGVFGVDTGTPILPPGEAAILAFGAVRETPWAHKGKVKLRQVTTLGLSFDHRIIDGELGSKFLRDIGAFLTDPEATLLAWT
ncbi:dihydrolipoamide acetyltransferase component of pyruvate dehydrogenase complex [Catellatospora sp. IY07-71]|uniref:dihydrolipoamide acetyltransferase family protein n=1 Tax=Catellatospora sp. IY07-71 TaxID=2728827 RepID=UPI001BB3F72F|nr:dihydrolipoamide acetyltransferase family protein [Catellatospora sp. IY07-71]BCJ71862.1 dihydrolipoamide acetyltransferase component of pyruvate dehydrogenase complex [Catellatospora sp. IY07-71]